MPPIFAMYRKHVGTYQAIIFGVKMAKWAFLGFFFKKTSFFNPDLRVEGVKSAEDMDRGKCSFFGLLFEFGIKKA
jgi:hypothetical protein